MTATPPAVTLASQAIRSDEVLFQDVAGEGVLLDLATEQYFGLDPVGTRIWSLLAQHSCLQDVLDTLCIEYDAEPARIADDLLGLASHLAKAGLIKLA